MRDMMEKVRENFVWQLEMMQTLNLMQSYAEMMETYEEIIDIRESLLEDYEENAPLVDRLTGKKRARIAELKKDLEEAEAKYAEHSKSLEELEKREAELSAVEPEERLVDLMEQAAEDPANHRELAWMNAQLCAVSVELEMMNLEEKLEELADTLEDMDLLGEIAREDADTLYGEIMNLAKECLPYLETFEAEMETLEYSWQVAGFFRDPDRMNPSLIFSVRNAAEEVSRCRQSMDDAVDSFMMEFL